MIYLDASVLVSIILKHSRGNQAIALMHSELGFTSEICMVECQAALSQHFASTDTGLPLAETDLAATLEEMQIVGINQAVLQQARALVRRYRVGLGLRTLDAIHIASCLSVAAQIRPSKVIYLTADRRQHAAFQAEGFSGTLLP
jgi:predicted nucleic acid-binding protein